MIYYFFETIRIVHKIKIMNLKTALYILIGSFVEIKGKRLRLILKGIISILKNSKHGIIYCKI